MLCYPLASGNIAVMPVRFVVPLPGPFYWVPKGRPVRPHVAHRSIRSTPAYWLLGGWVFEAAFWVNGTALIRSPR